MPERQIRIVKPKASLLSRLFYPLELKMRARREARLKPLVGAAMEAVLSGIAGQKPPVAEHFFYGAIGISPRHLATWYLFDTDDERAQAKSAGLEEKIDRLTRSELAAKGYPREAIPFVFVSFTSKEDIKNKTGGNFWAYFK